MSQNATLATHMDIGIYFDFFQTLENERSCVSPQTYWSLKISILRDSFCSSKFDIFQRFSHEPQNLRSEIQYFLGNICQFSAHVKKCHTCHGICMSLPLDPALATQRWQFDPQKAHNLTRLKRCSCKNKIRMEVSEELCLPRNMEIKIWKGCGNIMPVAQNDFWHTAKSVGMWWNARLVTRNYITQRWKPPKVTTFAKIVNGTVTLPPVRSFAAVASGCGWLRSQERRRANMP